MIPLNYEAGRTAPVGEKRMKIEYPAIFTHDEDGITVTFPDFPEAITCGATLEEALFNAVEVLDLTLKSRLNDEEPIPEPGHQIDNPAAGMVAPDANIQSALLVRFARGGRSISDLARALNTSWPAVARLEDPKHWPSLRQLEKAAAALGKHLVLSFE